MCKPDKNDEDVERESALISQWVMLTEERNAVHLPAANSVIPGAPAEWTPPPGIERHVPVLLLVDEQGVCVVNVVFVRVCVQLLAVTTACCTIRHR
jgi:hypothetical protein